MTVWTERIVGVTLLAGLGEPRMLNGCDEESLYVLARRGPDGVKATLFRDVHDMCAGDEAEEYASEMTNVRFKVAANLGRATLVADVVVDDGRQLHLDTTFTATGPASAVYQVQERLRDPETGHVFVNHQVGRQRFVQGTGTFDSDWGYLLRSNEGTLSACKTGTDYC